MNDLNYPDEMDHSDLYQSDQNMNPKNVFLSNQVRMIRNQGIAISQLPNPIGQPINPNVLRGIQFPSRPIVLRPGFRPMGVPTRPQFNSNLPLIAPKNDPKIRPVFQNLKVTTIKALPIRGRGRGRGRGARTSSFKDIPELECDVDPNELPYPKSLPYIPTDKNLPCWNLVNEDPFNDFIDAVHPDRIDEIDDNQEDKFVNISSQMNMKNSDLCPELEIEEVKKIKNLNGFELFSLVQKKNFEKSKAQIKDDEMLDENNVNSNINNRVKEIWKFLPDTTKNVWKEKAKRYSKLIEEKNKTLEPETSEKRTKEISKAKTQLDKHKVTTCNLVDIAATFKLLEGSFDEIAKATAEYKGPISEDSMLSLLLDGLTTSLVPLLALCNEIDELKDAYTKDKLINSVNNLTHIVPILNKLN